MDRKVTFPLTIKSGFTLIEIMIAVSIFGVFAVIYVLGQGNNVLDSIRIKENTMLYSLANNILNEVVINPPEFRESIISTKEFTKFEDRPDYSYSVEMKQITLPSFEGLMGEEDQEDSNSLIKNTLYNQIKDNFERSVWQAQVTVRNNGTQDSYSLATWIMNPSAVIKFNY